MHKTLRSSVYPISIAAKFVHYTYYVHPSDLLVFHCFQKQDTEKIQIWNLQRISPAKHYLPRYINKYRIMYPLKKYSKSDWFHIKAIKPISCKKKENLSGPFIPFDGAHAINTSRFVIKYGTESSEQVNVNIYMFICVFIYIYIYILYIYITLKGSKTRWFWTNIVCPANCTHKSCMVGFCGSKLPVDFTHVLLAYLTGSWTIPG